MKIWANTIVNNEENFIWFSIMSVIDYVDKIIIYDTGSKDKTIQIINEIGKIKKDKIIFKEIGEVDTQEFTKLRQRMLQESECDWILVLDGDEIWWNDSIKKVVKKIREDGEKIDGIVVPVVIPVGDIYHLQEARAGQYELLGRKGNFNLRVINRRIPGLHVDGQYPLEGYFDINNQLIHEKGKVVFLNTPYLHLTHLKRSSLKRKAEKFKYELGNLFPKDFTFPEVLYKPYLKITPSPWIKISGMELIKAKLLTPLRKFKRRIFNHGD